MLRIFPVLVALACAPALIIQGLGGGGGAPAHTPPGGWGPPRPTPRRPGAGPAARGAAFVVLAVTLVVIATETAGVLLLGAL